MSEQETQAGALHSRVKFVTILMLLIVAILFLAVNRFFPADTVDQQTVEKMNQMLSQFEDISRSFGESVEQMKKNNQTMTKLLSERGINRDSLYQNMLDNYGGDAERLQPPPDGVGGQYPPNRPNSSAPNSRPH